MSEQGREPMREGVEVVSHFVRHRNAMALYVDMGRVFEDYYLHMMQLGVRLEPEDDELLKEALACLTLFLGSRPNNEAAAWTINFRRPPLNVFVTGDSQLGNVVGRVFTEDVRVREQDLFFAQVTRPNMPMRQSTVEIHGKDMLRVVEQFHEQSEQFPARMFRQGGDAYAMVVAHPDIDVRWFDGLTAEVVRGLADSEDMRLLERRSYRFACGCDAGLIVLVMSKAFQGDVDAMLGGESFVEVRCPRCGGSFQLDREEIERHMAALRQRETEQGQDQEPLAPSSGG